MVTKIKTKDEGKTPELNRMQSPERVPCCVEALASFYRSHASVRHLAKNIDDEQMNTTLHKKESEKKESKDHQRYDSIASVGESRVWFASKNLTPCRMH